MTAGGCDVQLNPAHGVKPLDFGSGGVTGSVDDHGRLIALNAYHAQHGYVTLTAADPFPEDRRYDPAAVRAYRAGLAQLSGFGPDVESPVAHREASLLCGAIPSVALSFENGARASVITWAHGGGAFQQWAVDRPFRWRGRLSLQRCAYTQLTEGGPVPMPPTETRAYFADGLLTLENSALGWAAAIAGFLPGEPWEQRAVEPIEIDIAGQAGTTTLCYGLGPTAEFAQAAARRLAQSASTALDTEMAFWREALVDVQAEHRAVRRGLAYALMLAVPVGETLCVLTDHMLLPLSWNRDAYYVVRPLLSHWPDVVRRHLLWMFEVAERPGDVWGRCYLANGRIKDAAFQLDQQLYPLLELADYVEQTHDGETWNRLRPYLAPVITALLERKAPQTLLFPTAETPADDPLPLPYHFSSHILMWHTLRKITRLLEDRRLADIVEDIHRDSLQWFTVPGDGQPMFAYAIDGAGHHHRYHDANDFPLVLAPVWGFCPADDPVWRATIAFAFSEANVGGYYTGRLGSVHTRAPWPLGDAQDLLIARLLGDQERERRAWAHIERAARWDGALPEACDAQTGDVVSRHWFAWPNAALACVVQDSWG